MVATLKLRVSHLCLLLTLAVPYLDAQQSGPANDAPAVGATRQHDGLLEFALKRINPSDREYGQCLDEARKFAVEQTLNRGYFWSNLSALGLLGIFLVVIVHQQKVQGRRELIASESLTQYHNALARAEAQATEATKRNHALMQALTALSESGVPREPGESSAPKESPVKERKRVQKPSENGTAIPVAPVVAAARGEFRRLAIASPVPNRPLPATPDQKEPAGQDVDLVTRLNALQQQLNVYKEREKQLLRQVNDAELSLQKEQQRNRSLKGE